jgi:aryl-alcohol dehydrogenase-like predicted oxidoreductase
MPVGPGTVPLVVGTAQLTRRYGVAGNEALSEPDAIALVRRAAAAGVAAFDTAPVYGDAERVLGLAGVPTPVCTKVDPAGDVVGSVEESLRLLGRPTLDLVLFHDAGIVTADPTGAVERLLPLVGDRIARLGVSVYTPDEFAAALELPWVAAIQAPISVVDLRLQAAGLLGAAATAGVQVLARSVFLQGALLLDPATLPRHLAGLARVSTEVRGVAQEVGRPLDQMLVSFVRDLVGVTAVVLGVESASQLDEAVAAASSPSLPDQLRSRLLELGEADLALIDPRCWP